MKIDLNKIATERQNVATENLDTLSVSEALKIMNSEDKKVVKEFTEPYALNNTYALGGE